MIGMARRNFLGVLGAGFIRSGPAIISQEYWHSSWHGYRDGFIDGQGRVIDYSADRGFTTSEGQAYGLFLSLVADDRATFRKIFNWTNTNMASGRLGDVLPAWKWGLHAGKWGVISTNSAADADAWMAYALLEAARIWQDHDYGTVGHKLAGRIANDESVTINGFGRVLIPSASDFPDTQPVIVDPSYTPLFLAWGIAQATGLAQWKSIASTVPRMITTTSRHGFAPDWAWLPETPAIPPEGLPKTEIGSFDAIRCYLWAGMTAPDTDGARLILDALSGMARFLEVHPTPPRNVDLANNTMHGRGGIGFSGALLPYLAILGKDRLIRHQLDRVLGQRQASGLFGQSADYYTENLILFGLGSLSGVIRFGKEGKLITA
jgi:endoglucanase